MVFLSSKSGGPEGFSPIPSSDELLCEGQLHRKYSHRGSFLISLRFCVLWSEGFYGGRSANPATNLLKKKVTQLQEDVRTVGHEMADRWLRRSSSAL